MYKYIYIHILEKFMKSNVNIPLSYIYYKKGMYQIYQDLILILYRTIFF